jgi:predicted MFS family arabinose efflux permease
MPQDSAGVAAAHAAMTTRAFARLIAALTASSMLGTSAISILPTLAPEVARTYGIPAVWVGYQFSLTSAFMVVSLLFLGSASRRWGAGRVIQAGMALVGVALALVLIPHVAALIAASVVMGLGYGLIMPANSHLMMRFTQRARLNMVFSIQQTGIPLGAILAATIAPMIAVAWGWRWAIGALAAAVFVLVAGIAPQRRAWDDDRNPQARLPRNPFAGTAIVLANARLRNLSVSGFCFSGAQFCVATFTVVALVEQLGYGLVQAGLMLSLAQLSGIVSRLYGGWLADRLGDSITVLVWLASALTLFGFASLWLEPAWPVTLVCLLFAGYGAATVGWPGAYLAEVARLCPPGQVSTGTSGSLLFTNAGKTVTPLAFAAIQAQTQSYSTAYGIMGVLGVIGLAALLRAKRASATDPHADRASLPASAAARAPTDESLR